MSGVLPPSNYMKLSKTYIHPVNLKMELLYFCLEIGKILNTIHFFVYSRNDNAKINIESFPILI